MALVIGGDVVVELLSSSRMGLKKIKEVILSIISELETTFTAVRRVAIICFLQEGRQFESSFCYTIGPKQMDAKLVTTMIPLMARKRNRILTRKHNHRYVALTSVIS